MIPKPVFQSSEAPHAVPEQYFTAEPDRWRTNEPQKPYPPFLATWQAAMPVPTRGQVVAAADAALLESGARSDFGQ